MVSVELRFVPCDAKSHHPIHSTTIIIIMIHEHAMQVVE
jgi:hypothetical protein